MATESETTTTRRIAREQLLAFGSYAIVIWLASVLSLVGFSLSASGEPAVVESAMAMSTLFLPYVILLAGLITATHYLLETRIGIAS